MLRSTQIRTHIRGNSGPPLSKPGGLYTIYPTSRLILSQERGTAARVRGAQESLASFACPCPDSKPCLFLSPCGSVGTVCAQEFRRHSLVLIFWCPAISSVLLSSHLKKRKHLQSQVSAAVSGSPSSHANNTLAANSKLMI